jgi:aryl-alcohol dehydrogenase-like predicted oxidoreductase
MQPAAMPLNHYVTLGHSGLRVSPLCLGAMTFGEEWGWGSSVPESEAILARFLEQGGNFIDTANGYTLGHSETIIGGALAQDRSRRARVVMATKFYTNLFPGDPNGGGASRKSLTAACDESLRRLRTDYIDLYWMHAWDSYTPVEETMRALDDLVRAGKIRYIGFSDTPAWKNIPSSSGPSSTNSFQWRWNWGWA